MYKVSQRSGRLLDWADWREEVRGSGYTNKAAPSSPKDEGSYNFTAAEHLPLPFQQVFKNADLEDWSNPLETHFQYGKSSETQTAKSQEAAGFLIKTNR